jgi:multidrug resistance efflux pump
MQKIIRARNVRILLGSALIVLGLWAFLPYFTYNVASSAFVNAELIRITAPIAGRLTPRLPNKGDYISQDISMRLVDARVPDRRQLALFQIEFAIAVAGLKRAEKQVKELLSADRALVKRLKAHKAAMIEKLSHEIRVADAELESCRSTKKETGQRLARSEYLARTGLVSRQNLDRARTANATTTADCKAALAGRERLKSVRKAAGQGIFLEDGFNDTPYSQQQRDRLLVRRQRLEADIMQGRAQIAQLDAQIERELIRVKRMSQFQQLLPAGHIVWAVTASPGSTVVEGQTIIDLANCKQRFITVELPERKIESIKTGDTANVRLLGSDTWIKGTVRQLRGSAARLATRLLAAQIPKPEVRHVTVEVLLPPDSSSWAVSRNCNIGRLADVRFERVNFWDFDEETPPAFPKITQNAFETTGEAKPGPMSEVPNSQTGRVTGMN